MTTTRIQPLFRENDHVFSIRDYMSLDFADRKALKAELTPKRDPFATRLDLMAMPAPHDSRGVALGFPEGNVPADTIKGLVGKHQRLTHEPKVDNSVTYDPEASRWITTPANFKLVDADTMSPTEARVRQTAAHAAAVILAQRQVKDAGIEARITEAEKALRKARTPDDRANAKRRLSALRRLLSA